MCQFPRVGNLLCGSFVLSLSLKIDQFEERFTKERLSANRSRFLLNKSDVSDLLVIRTNRSQKLSDLLEKIVFFVRFLYSFSLVFPFFMPNHIAPVALRSFTLYKRTTVSKSLPWLFKMSDSERFAQVAHDKSATERFALLLTKNCNVFFPLWSVLQS